MTTAPEASPDVKKLKLYELWEQLGKPSKIGIHRHVVEEYVKFFRSRDITFLPPDKPILFTEFGYTTRADPAVRPWEWPEHLTDVAVDELAQAQAYHALLASFVDQPWFAGFFVWRMYADPDDVSQEAEWGFSPRGKLAELVLRDAFKAWWGADGPRPLGAALHRHTADGVGLY